MESTEEVLSLDLEEDDYLYRIRKGARIVYVSILNSDIIPMTDRTDSSRILAKLRSLPVWNEQWNTLTVDGTSRRISCLLDTFKPHRLYRLPVPMRLHQYYNFLDLTPVSRISDRVSFVEVQGKIYVLKIARFGHELKALHREIRAYGALKIHGFTFAPKFLGYVYEETRDRVMGFLMEALNGRHPDVKDLEICKDVMLQLHAVGIVHGDLNKYNIVIEGDKAKFIDFEAATFRDDKDYAKLELRETIKLAQQLADTSGVGGRGI